MVKQLIRKIRDRSNVLWMIVALAIVLFLPFLLGIGLYLQSSVLLRDHSLWQVMFSPEWMPMSGRFGMSGFIVSSLVVTVMSLLIAGPVCLLTAIHITQYSHKWVLRIMHPAIDILAGIPSVIYGVWGILVIVPLVSNFVAPIFGVHTSGYTLLAGAIVLAVMIIPFILNILIEVFRTIPAELTEASLSLGATRWQTVKHVIVRKAMPGIISAMGLGVSRAFGETIAVLMVVGNVPGIPTGILQPGYPLPALIANNYGEMMSIPVYRSALMFSAFVLFVVVMLFNLASRIIITRAELK
jgi:phosphate transport system permease protein